MSSGKNIKNLFFSKNNVNILINYLSEELDIKGGKKVRNAHRDLLITQMKLVFEKNHNKIKNVNPKIILPKLNEKAAKAVGISFPEWMLKSADKVIGLSKKITSEQPK